MTSLLYPRTLFASVVLCTSLSTWAADSQPQCLAVLPTTNLSLNAAISYGLCQNPDTQEVWAQLAAQQAAVAVAKDSNYPSLSLQGSASSSGNEDTSSNSVGVQARLSYVLFDFGQRDAEQGQAQALLSSAQFNADSTVATLSRDIVNAYLAVLKAQGQIEAAQQTVTSTAKSMASAEARFNVGTGTPLDVLQAKAAYAQARLTQVQADSQLATTRGQLAFTMGLKPTLLPTIAQIKTTPTELPFASSDIEQLLTQAVANRPEVKVAQASVIAAEQSILSAKAANKPTVSVSASTGVQESSGNSQTTGSVGLTVDVPFDFGGGKQARVRQSEAQKAAKVAALNRSRQSIEQQAWQAFYGAQAALATVHAAQDSLDSSDKAAKVAVGRYDAGVGTMLEVLNAQSQLANSHQQWVAARYDWLVARTQLAYALGQDFTTNPEFAPLESTQP
jgi:TolC family type I secretion outer membrane protein